MFPLRLRRPAAIALCATEFALGVGLLLTAGRAGAGTPALAVRAATALLFCTAVGALHELRARRPDAGCGCFGELEPHAGELADDHAGGAALRRPRCPRSASRRCACRARPGRRG